MLRSLDRGIGTLLLTVPLVLEYEATCQLPEHRLATGLSEADVGLFLDAIVDMAEPVESYFRWRPQLRDPGDEMVLEAAVNGRAEALVTFNRRDYGDVPNRFGVKILSPGEILKRMRA